VRITFIGGLDRNEQDLIAIAARSGHFVELHKGHMQGRGSEKLEAAIARADFVVLVTDVNSHGAVQLARRLCQRAGLSPLIVRRCGAARFAQICEALRIHERRLAAREVSAADARAELYRLAS
jgi:hypothetical protein